MEKYWDTPLNYLIPLFQSDPLPHVYKIKQSAFTTFVKKMCRSDESCFSVWQSDVLRRVWVLKDFEDQLYYNVFVLRMQCQSLG